MSNSQNALTARGSTEEQALERHLFILEKQLMDTLELQWQVEQVRIRLHSTTSPKARLLFEGMAGEVRAFIALIRKRLECLRKEEPHMIERSSNSYWRLFAADALEPREQFEAVLGGYAHYARQTSEAMTGLERAGDVESSELLAAIFRAVDRCLWFLEIYLEGLALKIDSNRLPDWSAVAAS